MYEAFSCQYLHACALLEALKGVEELVRDRRVGKLAIRDEKHVGSRHSITAKR